jgi:hypothetical protein
MAAPIAGFTGYNTDNHVVHSAARKHTGIPLYRPTHTASATTDAAHGCDTPGNKRTNRHALYCRTLTRCASVPFYLLNTSIAIAGLYSTAIISGRSSAFAFQRTCVNHPSSTTFFRILPFVTLSCFMSPLLS